MSDLIDRQAAIEAMCGACSDWCDEGVCRKVSAIQKLTPAQPEIIHCRECKHHIDGFFCQKANHHTSDTDCCASEFGAERREE